MNNKSYFCVCLFIYLFFFRSIYCCCHRQRRCYCRRFQFYPIFIVSEQIDVFHNSLKINSIELMNRVCILFYYVYINTYYTNTYACVNDIRDFFARVNFSQFWLPTECRAAHIFLLLMRLCVLMRRVFVGSFFGMNTKHS